MKIEQVLCELLHKASGFICCIIMLASLSITYVTAQSPIEIDKNIVLEKMLLANEYFMNKWPDPGVDIITDKRRPSNIWTRATYYEGLMALYRIKPDEKFYEYAVQWAESHNWGPAYGGTTTRNADNQACGQTYIELYQIDPKPERIEKIKTVIDNMINSSKIDDWWWIDALHMAMPIFAKLGVVYNDTIYFNRMYEMYMHTKTVEGDSGLYNKIDHLWWRDKNFDPPHTSPNGEDTYWSRGNGWVLAALARILDVMPENAPHRDEYIKTFKEMAEALVDVQREDGFWNVSLHDPNEYGGKEASGTAMFTFGLAWGINNGLLIDPVYEQAAIKGWYALANDALHENGFLGYVQSTGKQPSDGQPVTYDRAPNFEDYALGAFLLAGSEIYKIADNITGTSLYESTNHVTPNEVVVYPAYPNPFNPQTTISFNLTEASEVKIDLYDIQGQHIENLLSKTLNAGLHKLNYEGKYLSSGVYLLKIFIQHNKANKMITEKLVYLK